MHTAGLFIAHGAHPSGLDASLLEAAKRGDVLMLDSLLCLPGARRQVSCRDAPARRLKKCRTPISQMFGAQKMRTKNHENSFPKN